MTKRFRTVFLLTLLSSFVFPVVMHGSGPDTSGVLFTFIRHPENALLTKYAAGAIDLPQPEYHRTYLFAAYRHLSGNALSPAEQTALIGLWNEKFYLDDTRFSDDGAPTGVTKWLEARKKVTSVAELTSVEDRRETAKDSYQYFLNCPDDAFAVAAATLEDRIAKFGVTSPEVQDWVRAQDKVFENCSGGPSIPDPAPAGAKPPLAADRAYQIAAANFYAGNYDEAEKQFRAIASNPASPWRLYGPYLAARSMIRKASLVKDADSAGLYKKAEAQLRAVVADPGQQKLHASARGLIELVRQRSLSAPDRLRDLVPRIGKPGDPLVLKATLWDYKLLLDKVSGEQPYGDEPKPDPAVLTAAQAADDMTDWILTFQDDSEAARDRAIRKWKEKNSLPWLVAALAKADTTTSDAAALIDAAAKVPATSPGYGAVQFDAARLTIDLGRKDEARQKLDGLLAKNSFSPSLVNLLRAQRARVARSLDEFLTFAVRTPIGHDSDMVPFEFPFSADWNADDKLPRFDLDSIQVFNQKMPVAVLLQAGGNKALPTHLRRMVTLQALTRALLLGDETRVLEAIPLAKAVAPEMQEDLDAYAAAAPGPARKLAGLFVILRFPGLRVDADERTCGFASGTSINSIVGSGDAYWSTIDLTKQPGENDPFFSPRRTPIDTGGFLTAAQVATAKTEAAKIIAIGAAPTFLCKQAIAWAKQSPTDPRVPEALARAVKATRYGNTDDQNGTWSKAAYQVLHKQFPNNEWTKKTPYWFK